MLRLGLLLCFLLPFVTVGTSCSEFQTKPITGVQLVAGTTPEIVQSVSQYPYSSTTLSPDDVRQINTERDMARAGAIGLLVFTLAALVVAVRWRSRRAAAATILLGLLNLVALAMTYAAAASGGSAHLGVGLAYLLTLLAIIGDVYVFRRLGGRLAPVVVALIVAIPLTQIVGVLIGAQSSS